MLTRALILGFTIALPAHAQHVPLPGFDIIILTGKLEVLRDDPTGVFYRLTDAIQSQ